MEAFPLNANGKIDRKSLPDHDLTTREAYIEPENADQHKLVEIWSEVLGVEAGKISITSDFFSLGGHSLTAIKLKHEIGKYLKVELTLSEIFLTPTIISLSNKIKEWEAKEEENTIIISLNNEDTKEKLFVIHDGSGEIGGYLELTRKIEGYRCYGVKFGHFNDITKAPNITEIASKYVKEIKSIQSIGPYRLLGWSLGGVIATEMTSQLESAGENVENLIIVDSSFEFRKFTNKVVFDIESEIQLLKSKFGFSIKNKNSFRSINELWLQFSKSEILEKSSLKNLRNLIPEEIKQLIPDFLNMTHQELFEAVNIIRLLNASSENYYISKAVEARTLYIHPNESRAISNKKMQHYFENLALQQIAGDHFSVMKNPVVSELATIVNEHLGVRAR